MGKKCNWKMNEMFVATRTLGAQLLPFCLSLSLSVDSEQTNRKCVFVLSLFAIVSAHSFWFDFFGSFLTLNKIPEIKRTNRQERNKKTHEHEMQRKMHSFRKKLNYSSTHSSKCETIALLYFKHLSLVVHSREKKLSKIVTVDGAFSLP